MHHCLSRISELGLTIAPTSDDVPVLDQFPYASRKMLLAGLLAGLSPSDRAGSRLSTARQLAWALEVTSQAFLMPDLESAMIDATCSIYNRWLLEPGSRPIAVQHNPEAEQRLIQSILFHFSLAFDVRERLHAVLGQSGTDGVDAKDLEFAKMKSVHHIELCKQVLQSIIMVTRMAASTSSSVPVRWSPDTWTVLVNVVLGISDAVLSEPFRNDPIRGSGAVGHLPLREQIVRLFFEIWLRAPHRSALHWSVLKTRFPHWAKHTPDVVSEWASILGTLSKHMFGTTSLTAAPVPEDSRATLNIKTAGGFSLRLDFSQASLTSSWPLFLGLVPMPAVIPSAEPFSKAANCIVELVDGLLGLRTSYLQLQRQSPNSNIPLPPSRNHVLSIVGDWLLAASESHLGDSSFDSGRAQCIGTLCRIFTLARDLPTDEPFTSHQLASFYAAIESSLSNDLALQTILPHASVIVHHCLPGCGALIVPCAKALQRILPTPAVSFKLAPETSPELLRLAAYELIEAIMPWPAFFRCFGGDDSNVECPCSELAVTCQQLLDVKGQIMHLLLNSVRTETEPHNFSFIIGVLTVAVEDDGQIHAEIPPAVLTMLCDPSILSSKTHPAMLLRVIRAIRQLAGLHSYKQWISHRSPHAAVNALRAVLMEIVLNRPSVWQEYPQILSTGIGAVIAWSTMGDWALNDRNALAYFELLGRTIRSNAGITTRTLAMHDILEHMRVTTARFGGYIVPPPLPEAAQDIAPWEFTDPRLSPLDRTRFDVECMLWAARIRMMDHMMMPVRKHNCISCHTGIFPWEVSKYQGYSTVKSAATASTVRGAAEDAITTYIVLNDCHILSLRNYLMQDATGNAISAVGLRSWAHTSSGAWTFTRLDDNSNTSPAAAATAVAEPSRAERQQSSRQPFDATSGVHFSGTGIPLVTTSSGHSSTPAWLNDDTGEESQLFHSSAQNRPQNPETSSAVSQDALSSVLQSIAEQSKRELGHIQFAEPASTPSSETTDEHGGFDHFGITDNTLSTFKRTLIVQFGFAYGDLKNRISLLDSSPALEQALRDLDSVPISRPLIRIGLLYADSSAEHAAKRTSINALSWSNIIRSVDHPVSEQFAEFVSEVALQSDAVVSDVRSAYNGSLATHVYSDAVLEFYSPYPKATATEDATTNSTTCDPQHEPSLEPETAAIDEENNEDSAAEEVDSSALRRRPGRRYRPSIRNRRLDPKSPSQQPTENETPHPTPSPSPSSKDTRSATATPSPALSPSVSPDGHCRSCGGTIHTQDSGDDLSSMVNDAQPSISCHDILRAIELSATLLAIWVEGDLSVSPGIMNDRLTAIFQDLAGSVGCPSPSIPAGSLPCIILLNPLPGTDGGLVRVHIAHAPSPFWPDMLTVKDSRIPQNQRRIYLGPVYDGMVVNRRALSQILHWLSVASYRVSDRAFVPISLEHALESKSVLDELRPEIVPLLLRIRRLSHIVQSHLAADN